MPENFRPVFARLREILKAHAAGFTVGIDTSDQYSLDAPPGPATLKAWRGKLRSPTIQAASVQVRKSYVSFHLMGIYTCPKLLDRFSEQLKRRMQGKACLNFKEVDEPLFEELERLTAESLAGMRQAGFIEG